MHGTVTEIARERIRDVCDKKGISWVRANLPNEDPPSQAVYREWIDEYENVENAQKAAEQMRLTQDGIDAARLAAEIAGYAAAASRLSAKWTMWAALAAAFSALAAALSAALPILQAYGWLPKP